MNRLRLAGVTAIVTSLAFVAVFGYLAARFGYPEVLEGDAAHVLPALLAGGAPMRAVWIIYAVLPAGVAAAALLSYPWFRAAGASRARVGLAAALLASLAMTLGLARWPTLNDSLARAFAVADAGQRQAIAATFDAGNLYLGNVIGEFIGEVCLCAWFLTTSLALAQRTDRTRWLGRVGLCVTASLFAGAFRNLTDTVAPIAEVNNSLLPLWLITFGVSLIVLGGETAGAARPLAVPAGRS
jgi:uncharacterized protein DUF4386